MGADNQAEKVMDRIARLEAAETEIERLCSTAAEATTEIARLTRHIQDLHGLRELDKIQIEWLRNALQKIASCDKRVDGDVVDIARIALGGN